MSDIMVTDLAPSECYVSVWNQDDSNCIMPFRPEHTMTLHIANGKNRKPCPWFHSIEFTSRKEWFKFVKLVNSINKKVKNTPADKYGFPIMDKLK